ncbi:hypothetical protein PIB30_078343 [Stylosanthes scabra]|uniref:Uncharacterized protein n=1 Tax=Stylosanthes scabra TaxID=79078 RepID=A0ABU6XR05_9FABA|nr:hypothetical protein [Stylosanthes scabra]
MTNGEEEAPTSTALQRQRQGREGRDDKSRPEKGEGRRRRRRSDSGTVVQSVVEINEHLMASEKIHIIEHLHFSSATTAPWISSKTWPFGIAPVTTAVVNAATMEGAQQTPWLQLILVCAGMNERQTTPSLP